MTKTRINWIDIAKGIGILLVILGHSPRDIMVDSYPAIHFMFSFIYSFHMPLFFFLAGVTFHSFKKSDGFIIKKTRQLFIPLICYSLTIYAVFYIADLIPFLHTLFENASMGVVPLKEYILDTLNINNPYAFHTWYIWVLFIIEIIMFIYEKYILRKKSGSIVYLIPVVLVTIIIHFFVKLDLALLNYVVKNLFYFSLGVIYSIKGGALQEKHNKKIVLKLLFSVGIIMTILHTLSAINVITFNEPVTFILNDLQFLIGNTLMILLIVNLSKKIADNKFLIYLGQNSFNIYLLHQPFCCAVIGMVLVKILPANLLCYILIMIVCSICSIILPLLFVKLVNKIKMGKVMEILYNVKPVNKAK